MTTTKSKFFQQRKLEGGEAFCAGAPNKYRCRFRSTCEECFAQSTAPCAHFEEKRLKLLLVGNNPSTHVWEHGYSYGNPTNRMWKLLTGSLCKSGENQGFQGLLPTALPIEAQNRLPHEYGIGLADIGLVPGNDASKIQLRPWVANFYARLRRHIQLVREHEGSGDYLGPTCLAFTGKGQFQSLYSKEELAGHKLEFGLLPETFPWPPGFPLAREETHIWILTSSSGRAAMTHEARIGPYRDLAVFVSQF